MGLTSARDTPSQEIRMELHTPTTPTPSNLLDTLRKPTLATTGLKEHERAVEELKKENFDLKLKCYQMEDQLRKQTPANTQAIFSENETLRANNEALSVEIRSLKQILSEAQNGIESLRRNTSPIQMESEAEANRLRQEFDLVNGQLARSINQIKNYEQQLELFDQESRETLRRTKQLELELAAAQKKLFEAGKLTQEQQAELRDLNEELQSKNVFVEQVKQESQAIHAELEMSLRQRQELENRIRVVEQERDTIRNELDPTRRRLIVEQSPSSSPRSSIDLLEGRLLRQIGNTSKQVDLLTKSNALTQSEKEQLAEQARRLSSELNAASQKTMLIFERITALTGLKPNGAVTHETPLDYVIDELAKLCEAILSEYEQIGQLKDKLDEQLENAHHENVMLRHEEEKAKEQTRSVTEQLTGTERDLGEVRLQLQRSQSEYRRIEQQLKTVMELDLPRYQAQCDSLQNAIRTLEVELKAREKSQTEAKKEIELFRQRCAELELNASSASVDVAQRKEELNQLSSQKRDLLQKLATQEDLSAAVGKKLDEARQQLAQAERIKMALEENFNKELRSLHLENTELRGQLASLSNGKTSNDQVLERAQATLRFVEQSNKELLEKLQSKEAAYSGLLRKHENICIEKQNLERELVEAEESLRRVEVEMSRLKRAESSTRRNNEGIEHLQVKLESLSSLNTLLKEQAESKDKHLREVEEKLRKQDEAIRKAYADCEHQHQKIKKREMVISRVLKRLENINVVAGLGGMMDEEVNNLEDRF